jgi:hypothetical protein
MAGLPATVGELGFGKVCPPALALGANTSSILFLRNTGMHLRCHCQQLGALSRWRAADHNRLTWGKLRC